MALFGLWHGQPVALDADVLVTDGSRSKLTTDASS